MKVMRSRSNGKKVKKSGGLRLYPRFDPTVNGNGGGGAGNGGADSATTDTSTGHSILVASDPSTVTNAVNRGLRPTGLMPALGRARFAEYHERFFAVDRQRRVGRSSTPRTR